MEKEVRVCNATLDRNDLVVYLHYIHKETLNLTFVITDLEMDCPYYSWTQDMYPDATIWIASLNLPLRSIALSSKTFSGLRCKIYHNGRLLQVEELPYNKNRPTRHSFITGEFDLIGPSYLDFFHSNLCEGIDTTGVVIDAGANVGFFSLYALENGAQRIYSIEPDDAPFYYLNKNFENNNRVTTINKALTSNCDGMELFHVLDTSVASSATKITDNSIVGFVESINLSSILSVEKNINLVKLDIEGSEFEVLETLTDIEFSKINQFFIEFHSSPKTLVEILETHGFRVQFIRSSMEDSMGFIYGDKQ